MTKTRDVSICPNCGSTDFLPDYPAPGTGTCMECGKEIIKLELENTPSKKTPEKCSSCNTVLDCIREEENEDFAVFKCSRCGKISGYQKRHSAEFGSDRRIRNPFGYQFPG